MRTRADEERLINPLIGPGSLIEPLGLLSIQMLRCFCVTFFVINSNFELIILRNDSVKRCGGETGGGVQDKALEFIPSFCCLRALFFVSCQLLKPADYMLSEWCPQTVVELKCNVSR